MAVMSFWDVCFWGVGMENLGQLNMEDDDVELPKSCLMKLQKIVWPMNIP